LVATPDKLRNVLQINYSQSNKGLRNDRTRDSTVRNKQGMLSLENFKTKKNITN